MADLTARADADVLDLLGHLVRAHPDHALNVLIETGAIEQAGWWQGDDKIYRLDLLTPPLAGTAGLVALYRVVPKTEETG